MAVKMPPPRDPSVFSSLQTSSGTPWGPKWYILHTRFLSRQWGRHTRCFNARMAFDLVLPALSMERDCGHVNGHHSCQVQTGEVLESPASQRPDWDELSPIASRSGRISKRKLSTLSVPLQQRIPTYTHACSYFVPALPPQVHLDISSNLCIPTPS